MRKRKEAATPAEIGPEQLQMLDVEATARLLCVGRTTVYALIRAREIEAVRIGKSRRILLLSVWHYIERQKRLA